MLKQIIGYIPSNIVPAIVSMAMIYAYTRMLTPVAFGIYSFIFTIVLIAQTSLFYALPMAVLRFFPAALGAGRPLDCVVQGQHREAVALGQRLDHARQRPPGGDHLPAAHAAGAVQHEGHVARPAPLTPTPLPLRGGEG